MRGSYDRGLSMIKQPHYIGLEEARQILAQMGVQLTLRQMQGTAEQDGPGTPQVSLLRGSDRAQAQNREG